MQIKIKKLYDDTIIPTKAHSTDACFDIYAYLNEPFVVINPGQTVKINTGFVTEIPKGYYCDIYARSGLGIKKGLRPSNCVGIIDADYRGDIGVILINLSNEPFEVKPGERIAQLVIAKYEQISWEQVEVLDETERGNGGYGHTGVK